MATRIRQRLGPRLHSSANPFERKREREKKGSVENAREREKLEKE